MAERSRVGHSSLAMYGCFSFWGVATQVSGAASKEANWALRQSSLSSWLEPDLVFREQVFTGLAESILFDTNNVK